MHYLRLNEYYLKEFLEIRNSCTPFLHDDSIYTYEECLEWFRSLDKNHYYLCLMDDSVNPYKVMGYFRIKLLEEWTAYELMPIRSVEIGMDLAESYRGKGIATKYYQDLLREFFKHGYESATLEVLANNIPAYNLYLKLGFRHNWEQEVKIVTRKDGTKIPSIAMTRCLRLQ